MPSQRSQVIRAAVSDVVSVVVVSLIASMAIASAPEFITFIGALIPALAIAWLAARAWRNPAAIKPVGLGVWAATAMVGLAILTMINNGRLVWQMITIIVVFLAILMLGWRFLAGAMERQNSGK